MREEREKDDVMKTGVVISVPHDAATGKFAPRCFKCHVRRLRREFQKEFEQHAILANLSGNMHFGMHDVFWHRWRYDVGRKVYKRRAVAAFDNCRESELVGRAFLAWTAEAHHREDVD